MALNKDVMTFLERALNALADFEPVAIAITSLNNKGECFSEYFKCSFNDLNAMKDVMDADAMISFIRANRDYVKVILDGEDEPYEDS